MHKTKVLSKQYRRIGASEDCLRALSSASISKKVPEFRRKFRVYPDVPRA